MSEFADYTPVYQTDELTFCTNGMWVDVTHTPCGTDALWQWDEDDKMDCSVCGKPGPKYLPKGTHLQYDVRSWGKGGDFVGPSPREWVARWLNVEPEQVEVSIDG